MPMNRQSDPKNRQSAPKNRQSAPKTRAKRVIACRFEKGRLILDVSLRRSEERLLHFAIDDEILREMVDLIERELEDRDEHEEN